jgi:hypothetical protein
MPASCRLRVSVLLPALFLVLIAAAAGPAERAHAAKGGGGKVAVMDLRTDNVSNPLGIDNREPRLGWTLHSKVNGERQTAYQVIVASSAGRVRSGAADVWDSGRVASDESVDVAYGGPELESARRYHWKVRVWDARGKASAWSAPAWWETGLLSPEDWGAARWISPETEDASASWSDYTVDLDFTIASGAAGVVFRAQGSSDFYMWQINTRIGDSVLLRPHVQQGGAWRVLKQVPLDDVIPMEDANDTHHISISVRGSEIATRINGTLVDTTTDGTFAQGPIGFRSGDGFEDARYDNVVVRGSDGAELFSDDFSTTPDPQFPNARVEDGALRTAGGDLQIMSAVGPEAPLLRKDFTLEKPIASARAYAYGLGWYELRLSGRKASDRVLAPAATRFTSRNLYQTYDVTDQVRRGDNTIGLWLAEGYGPTFSQYGWRWFGPRQALLKLDVTYTDGTTEQVVTDESWRWSDGPITSAHIYDGETYDARLEQPGWDEPGYDAGDWKPVRNVAPPSPRLAADTAPPVRVTDTLRPVAVREPEPGVYVFDLGQNIAGWARLRVAGERGTTVRMRFAEAVHEDGSLDTFTNRGAKATDVYVLAGTGKHETYEPRFTYHGFRYVEVTGLREPPTLETIEGRAVHADVEHIGAFDSSDALLNQIHANNRWTMLNNSMSYPTDTAVRDERTPPGMDVQAYQDAATRDFGMNAFYAKYLEDMGGAGLGGSPEMNGAYVTLAWTLYEQYGDTATLARSYPAMSRYVDSLAAKAPDGIWPDDDGFGDWCPPVPIEEANGGLGGPDVGGYERCFSEISLVNTAIYYRQADVTSRAAAELGRYSDASRYAALADRVEAAFNEHFGNAAGNGYGSGRQVTSVLPLAFGMVPDDRRAAVGAELVRTVLEDDDGHLDTGIFGTRYLVDALVEAGRPDVALTVLRQRTYPGFGFQIGLGATTAWEEWTYRSGMHTYDHAMFAGIDASYFTEFAGIEPAEPGYERIRIKPAVPAELDRASASIDTVRGPVRSSWRVTSRVLQLDVTIPVTATAEIHVPLRPGSEGRPNPVIGNHGLKPQRLEDGHAVFKVGSGSYRFVSR